jgi:hypothetical protein
MPDYWQHDALSFLTLTRRNLIKTITIPKRKLFITLGVAIALTLSILVIRVLPLSNSDPVHSPDDAAASTAATRALEAFYQIDYREGQEIWLERICTATTPPGCQFLKLGVGLLWEQLVAAKVQVTASVEPEEKLSDTESEQVWRMQITLSEPLPGSDLTEDSAYVLVVKTDARWLFERFLMAQEIEALEANQESESSK